MVGVQNSVEEQVKQYIAAIRDYVASVQNQLNASIGNLGT